MVLKVGFQIILDAAVQRLVIDAVAICGKMWIKISLFFSREHFFPNSNFVCIDLEIPRESLSRLGYLEQITRCFKMTLFTFRNPNTCKPAKPFCVVCIW